MISDVPGTEHMGRAGVELTTGRRWTALILLVMRRSPVRLRQAAPTPEAHSDHGRGLCASEGANSRRLVTLSPGDYALSRPGRRCRRRPRRYEGASQVPVDAFHSRDVSCECASACPAADRRPRLGPSRRGLLGHVLGGQAPAPPSFGVNYSLTAG